MKFLLLNIARVEGSNLLYVKVQSVCIFESYKLSLKKD